MKWWVGAIGLLMAGLIFRLGLLVYATYVLLGVLLISRFVAREWIEKLVLTRYTDGEAVRIGESVNVTLTLRYYGLFPVVWLLVEDYLSREALIQNPPRLRVHGQRLDVLGIPRQGEKKWEYRLECLMRGYYRIGPLLLETGDLFGLHRRYRVAAEPHYVLVYPKVVPLEGYDLASRRPIGEVRITHRLFEDPTRIAGVRRYQRGDPLNRIHWRATARTGWLHSKTYEPSTIAGATLLLDFHEEAYPETGRIAQSELAITTAASLANAVYEMGQQVGLVTNGRDAAERIKQEGGSVEYESRRTAKAAMAETGRNNRLRPVTVETRRGARQLTRILETLARVEFTDGLPFSAMIREVASRIPRDATVVAILSSVSEDTAIAMGALRRSGFLVTAVVVNFEQRAYHDWAQPPEWAARLLSAGIDFRRVTDEASLRQLCAERLVPT